MIKEILDQNPEIRKNSREMEKLREYFPNCFDRDGKFDLEKFKEEISEQVDFTKESYRLDFLGKSYAKYISSLETETVLEPDLEHNQKPENANSENIYITGDNLDVLKHLLRSYERRVKCIYIDPPYNTGNDDFVYQDNFNFTPEKLVEALGVEEEEAERIHSMTSKGSASHSAWLTFIYPRLYLARYLLKEDGIIFVSIDDNEQAQIKSLCDEIFGEENFVGCLPTIMNLKGNNDQFGFAGTHEYILVYGKNKQVLKINEFILEEEEIEEWLEDEYGMYKKGANLKSTGENAPREKRPNLYFPLYIDENGKYCSTERVSNKDFEVFPLTNNQEMSWRWGIKKINKEQHNLIIEKSVNGISIYKKQRPSLGDLPSKKPKSIFYKPDYSSGNGTVEQKKLFGQKLFPNPKPLTLIRDIVHLSNIRNKEIILDFFSGSATTAHAVMELNAGDGGNRKYILVQLDEKVKPGKEAEKAGYRTIDEIGRKRIELAAEKIRQEPPEVQFDGGFRHYRLRRLPEDVLEKMEEFDPQALFHEEGMRGSFEDATVLATWVNSDGYGLTAKPVEVDLDGYVGYWQENHFYLIHPNLTEFHVHSLINKYHEKSEFAPKKVIVFGYGIDMTVLSMLRENLRQLEFAGKEQKVELQIRE